MTNSLQSIFNHRNQIADILTKHEANLRGFFQDTRKSIVLLYSNTDNKLKINKDLKNYNIKTQKNTVPIKLNKDISDINLCCDLLTIFKTGFVPIWIENSNGTFETVSNYDNIDVRYDSIYIKDGLIIIDNIYSSDLFARINFNILFHLFNKGSDSDVKKAISIMEGVNL